MTKDEIIRMAREAGFVPRLWSRYLRDADARADRRAARPLHTPERAASDE